MDSSTNPTTTGRSPSSEALTPTSSSHVSNMINSRHYVSPSRPIYSDRFIPSRTGSNFALFHILSPAPARAQSEGAGEGKEEGSSWAYRSLLRAAMFGPEKSESPNIFRYKSETRQSLHLPRPFALEEAGPGVSRTPVKAPRKVPKSPYKVLDARALEDYFYLNLVDWSAQNMLAVGLGNCVYLWNACSSKVTKLCDLGIDDSVYSVGWSHRAAHLAVGTKNRKVQVIVNTN